MATPSKPGNRDATGEDLAKLNERAAAEGEKACRQSNGATRGAERRDRLADATPPRP